MRNIVLTVAYDGTGLLGWQKCADGPTVEEVLGKAIAQILQHPVNLQAASRTDAGVHADGQVVNFFTEKSLSTDVLRKGINALLPKSVRVMAVTEGECAFHPTLDSRGKEYHYYVSTASIQLPYERHYSWHYPHVLDLQKMEQAAQQMVGERDFAAFMGSCDPKPASTTRHLVSIDIEHMSEANYRFKVRGHSFLYKMVRNIVGTLVYTGRGKIEVGEIEGILEGKMRSRAGITAPAHGLRLKKVFYDL